MSVTLKKRHLILLISCLSICFFFTTKSNTLEKYVSDNTQIRYCTVNANDRVLNDEKRVAEIQQRIFEIHDKLSQSMVKVETGNSFASGVMISEDGYILTAAHVIDAVEKNFKVRLHDGSQYLAVCLGKDYTADYGLMKIEPLKKLVFSQLGDASNLAKDEACLMIGYPGSSEKDPQAITRIGFYKGITANDYLKTSCIMKPGDSGGPLFNLNGEVVGVCSYINKEIDGNFYSSVENVKKNWKRLISGETINHKKVNYDDSITQAPNTVNPFVLKGGKKTLVKVLSEKNKTIYKAVVEIRSIHDSSIEKITLGSIFSKDGYIVAKSSEIGEDQIYCTLYNGSMFQASLIGRDKDNDLAVLKIKTKEKLNSIDITTKQLVYVGEILGTVLNNERVGWSGIVGLEADVISTRNIGYLGVDFKQSGEATIKSVSDGQAANKAGLLSDDKIIEFNLVSIGDFEDLIKALSDTKPGQKVVITILRDDAVMNIDVVLGERDFSEHKHHIADNVITNRVKDGFPYAYTHDMPLDINQCGTPLINLDGKVVGLNISRRNRVSSLAIPLEHLEKVLSQILRTPEKDI